MAFRLVRERSRVRVEPGGEAALEVVYALDRRLPTGARQKLVPALSKALEERGLKLLALDIFDEFLRLSLPLEASAKAVEEALDRALRGLEPASAPEVPQGAEEQLERYLSESPR